MRRLSEALPEGCDTILDEFEPTPEITVHQLSNSSLYAAPAARTAGSQMVAITKDIQGISREEAKRRLLEICRLRGLRPVNGRVHCSARAYYMEAIRG